jgi:hypothetical protein
LTFIVSRFPKSLHLAWERTRLSLILFVHKDLWQSLWTISECNCIDNNGNGTHT